MRYLAAIQPLWTPEEEARHHREEQEWHENGTTEAFMREGRSPVQPSKPIYREVEAEDELHAHKQIREWWLKAGQSTGTGMPRDIDVSLVPVSSHTTIRFSVIGSIAGEADIT